MKHIPNVKKLKTNDRQRAIEKAMKGMAGKKKKK